MLPRTSPQALAFLLGLFLCAVTPSYGSAGCEMGKSGCAGTQMSSRATATMRMHKGPAAFVEWSEKRQAKRTKREQEKRSQDSKTFVSMLEEKLLLDDKPSKKNDKNEAKSDAKKKHENYLVWYMVIGVIVVGLAGAAIYLALFRKEQKQERKMKKSGDKKKTRGGSKPGKLAETEWKEFYDPEGRPYYYNEVTGRTQWEFPLDGGSASEAGAMSGAERAR
uniref:WW domain-containing protein n=1 Tax=Chromera velia CCMP2878 TaxID=1169474 RepID=A0A0G4GTI9_9ALVE|eukprot:Cvel_23263.t1-p1 / transcript=Cvel_23263.t1 / gene=Cvel_23263 / organism=Chromera_velia_CCMP2878 / gene_product=hypothetical protein / transcript_product=hypothetical protein / location=Cvel_scaffold2378:9749-12194(-) / protein_length=220 / sequence_SO=supercontig / SO=protein_coding / is_pseudo=false